MDNYYRAYVKVRGSRSNPKLISGGPSKDELQKWCHEIIAENRGTVLDAWIDKDKPEPREGKVWVWHRPKDE